MNVQYGSVKLCASHTQIGDEGPSLCKETVM